MRQCLWGQLLKLWRVDQAVAGQAGVERRRSNDFVDVNPGIVAVGQQWQVAKPRNAQQLAGGFAGQLVGTGFLFDQLDTPALGGFEQQGGQYRLSCRVQGLGQGADVDVATGQAAIVNVLAECAGQFNMAGEVLFRVAGQAAQALKQFPLPGQRMFYSKLLDGLPVLQGHGGGCEMCAVSQCGTGVMGQLLRAGEQVAQGVAQLGDGKGVWQTYRNAFWQFRAAAVGIVDQRLSGTDAVI